MQRFFTNEITDYLISEINTKIKTTLNLKIIQKGKLDLIIDDNTILKNYTPSLFVDIDSVEIEDVTMQEYYVMNYNYHVIYMNSFEPNDEYIKNKYTNTEKIAEMLIDNIQLSGLVLSNGGIISSIISNINFSPAEERDLRSVYGDIYISVISFVVKVQTQK